jgi:hypothetical protein
MSGSPTTGQDKGQHPRDPRQKTLTLHVFHANLLFLMNQHMNKSLTIRLTDNLRKDILDISCQKKVPTSSRVRDSLRRHIAIYQFRKLRSQVLLYAEAQGILTDNDVFQAVS